MSKFYLMKSKPVIAVVGTRSTGNKQQHEYIGKVVQQYVNKHKNEVIWMSGGCASGADYWIKKYCKDNEYRYIEAPVFWTSMFNNGCTNKYAGPYRNQTIAMICDSAYVFWDGRSPGTRSFLEAMDIENKPYEIIGVGGKHPLDKLDLPKRPPGAN